MRLAEIVILALFGIAVVWVLITAPPGSLSPFCTYTTQYELTASLHVDGQILVSSVRTQHSQSRRWVSTINSGGCQQSHGRTLAFKASDGRAFLIPTLLCPLAEDVLMDVQQVDVLRICQGRWPNKAVGFIVNTADRPTVWGPFDFSKSGAVKLVAMEAKSYTWGSPDDNIDELLPALAETFFDDGGSWWNSPNRILRLPKEIVYRAAKADGSTTMRGAQP